MITLAHCTPTTTPILALEAPVLIQSAANLREHHHAKAKRVAREREAVTAALWAHAGRTGGPVLLSAHGRLLVSFTRLATRLLDDDNLVGGCKASRDSVAAWLGVDDRDPRVTWGYDQRTHKRYSLTPGLLIEVRP